MSAVDPVQMVEEIPIFSGIWWHHAGELSVLDLEDDFWVAASFTFQIGVQSDMQEFETVTNVKSCNQIRVGGDGETSAIV